MKEAQASVSPISEEFSPTSPTSPKSSISPLSAVESGMDLDKLLQSADRRKSIRDKRKSRNENGVAAAFGYPVLDFTSFKAEMDTIHGLFTRELVSPSETVSTIKLHLEPRADYELQNYEGDTEMSDIDIDDDTYSVGPRSGPLNFGYSPKFDEERDVVIEVLPEPLVSPRRNAWDWSVGGLGTDLVSMDGFLEISP